MWLVAAGPLLLGERTLFLRDVFSNHFPNKAFGAEELGHGHLPAFNPALGLGLPFRGNGSFAPFYPGNVLYLLLPLWSAFGAHYALHWLLAAAAMAILARTLEMGRWGSLLASISYAGCGWVLSTLSFYNVLGVAAWWPLVMAGAARGGRSGVALGALAAGLAFLAGDPITWALGLLPLGLVAVQRHGWRRGGATTAFVALLGLLVALPQIVATSRVLPFSLRGWRGMSAAETGQYALHPLRFLELVLPLPWGWPGWVGPRGWWGRAIAERWPFYFSLYPGIVALWLAWLGGRAARARPWAVLAGMGLVAAWAGGPLSPILMAVSGGLFRFPEKFIVWFALAVPLLAGWGVDRLGLDSGALPSSRPAGRLAVWMAGALAALGGLVLLARSGLVAAIERSAPESTRAGAAGIAAVQSQLLAISLLLAGALLAAAVFAARRRQWLLLWLLQLVALAQLWPLVATDSTGPYRARPAWVDELAELRAAAAEEGASRLALAGGATVREETVPAGRLPPGPMTSYVRLESANLDPTPGVLYGLSYPVYRESEGLGSSLQSFWIINLFGVLRESSVVMAWMRVVGARAMVLFDDPAQLGLPVLAFEERLTGPTWLAAVPGPAPPAFWPRSVETAATPVEALRRVGELGDPLERAILSEPVAHHGRGAARLLEEHGDRLVVESEGEGGLVVVQRGYHPLYEARAGGRRLRTQPVDLILLGVEVPPGKQRVEIDVSARPEAIAGGVALGVVAALLALAWRGRGG